MSACTFFGHSRFLACKPESIYAAVEKLILEQGVEDFYVGHNGLFDQAVLSVLRKIREKYPHIRYSVVLAYRREAERFSGDTAGETVLPEAVASAHPRFAIDKRNRYMLSLCDFVISCVVGPGGAKKFTDLAVTKGKSVINLADGRDEKTCEAYEILIS